MKNAKSLRFLSTVTRVLTLGVAAILATTATFAKSGTGLGGSGVIYSVPRQIVQGNMPLVTSYTLQITSPANLTPGVSTNVTLNTSLLTAPGGISQSQALSFVTITPMQTGLIGGILGGLLGIVGDLPLVNQIPQLAPVLTFTGPNQTLSVTVNVSIPDGAWAGSFGYEILTSGWPTGLVIEDPGAFINITASRVAAPSGPVITINQPVDQTVYTWVAGSEPLEIPYVLVGSTLDGSPLTAMNATVSNANSTQDLGVTPSGLGTANATATGTFTVSAPGVYTITANDANAVGTATSSVQITVQVISGPPTVSIDSPDAGSAYVMTGNQLVVPFTISGTSQYSGVRVLTLTLDGTPVALTPSGYGNLNATGAGNLIITSAGDHVLAATCTDDYGTATTSETITVTVQANNPPPTVVINTPAPNATYNHTTGGAAVSVPFTFTGSSTGGPITSLTATMDGVPVSFSTSGLGTQTANGTTSLSFTDGGNHTLAVTATNDVGTASTSEVITIVEQAPQAATLRVAILKPTVLSYTMPSNGCPLTIADGFTSNSTAASGVTSLTVTFNGNPVSVTTSTLGKPVVTANGTIVVTAPGVYALSVTATDQNGSATTSTSITVAAPTPTPKISIVKPCDGAQYTVGTSSCPLWVAVSVTGNTSPGSTLSTFTLTLNGQPVTYTSLRGLNTISANGTVNIKITQTGTYTLVATTTSGGVSVTDTNTFKVVPPSGCSSGWGSGWGWNSHDDDDDDHYSGSSWGSSWGSGSTSHNVTPTPCNVNWEQSWSCNTTQTGGKTFPLNFHIQYTGSNCTNYWSSYFKNCSNDYYSSDNDSRKCWGNYGYVNCVYGNVPSSSSCLNNKWDSINGSKYSDDTTVKVVCYEIKSNGSTGTPTVFTCNAKTNGYKISSNNQYSCNIVTAKGTHTYRYDVYYTDKNTGKQCFLGSQQFRTK